MMPIYDLNLCELLVRITRKEIIPSPALRDFVSNDFMTIEERQFRKQYVATWAAIILSGFLGISGILLSTSSSTTQAIEGEKLRNVISEKTIEVKTSIEDLATTVSTSNSAEIISEGIERIINELSDLHESTLSFAEAVESNDSSETFDRAIERIVGELSNIRSAIENLRAE